MRCVSDVLPSGKLQQFWVVVDIADDFRLRVIKIGEYYSSFISEFCAAQKLKENKLQSQWNFQKDTLLGLCQKERYHYNNFKRSKVYLNSNAVLKKEYDALFERFKAQLAEYKVKLKTDKDGVAAFACAKWFEKIRGEREDLENRFHSSLLMNRAGLKKKNCTTELVRVLYVALYS